MATLAKLVVKLITDVTEFSKGMDTAVQKYAKIGASMQSIGDKMTKGVTLPLLAAGTAAVKFASDLSETRNKTAVVFGEMADQVMAMGKESALAMGMSENASLGFASTFGAIEKNMGLSTDQVADMSIKLTQLTADYASFHNLKPEEAFEKIKAGLVGSSEPLISLGKDLRQGAVEAYAMANGIGENGRQLSIQELALARYGLLLSQSTDELGDFARTSDGLANSTRIVKAEFENVLAGFGESLLPIATDLMKSLIPILDWFNNLDPAAKKGIVSMLMFVAALGPVMSVGGRVLQLGKWLTGVLGAKGLVGAFSKLVPLTVSAGGATGSLGGALAAAALPVVGLIAAIGLLIVVIKRFGPEAWNSAKMLGYIIGKFLVETVGGGLVNVTNLILNWLKNLPAKISGFGKNFFAAGRNMMIGLINGIKSAAVAMIQAVLQPVAYVIEQVKRMLHISSPSKVFAGIGQNMMLGLAQGIEQYAPKSIDASITAVSGSVGGVMPAGIGTGGRSGIIVEFKEINIQGDLSESSKKSLRAEVKDIFTTEFKAILDGV